MNDLVELTNWIYFPIDVAEEDRTVVSWSEDGEQKTAAYYHVNGWFAKSIQGLTNSAKPLEIFIAEEYIAPRYEKALPIKKLHVANLDEDHGEVGPDEHGVIPEPSSKSYQMDGFATMKVDKKFLYGQSKTQKSRWVVYHPMERLMTQGAFKKDRLQRTLESIVAKIPSVHLTPAGFADITLLEMDDKKAGNLLSWAGGMFGDPLRSFLQLDEAQRARDALIEKEQKTVANLARAALMKGKLDSVPIVGSSQALDALLGKNL